MGKYNAVHHAVMSDITGIATLTHDPLVVQNIKREKNTNGVEKTLPRQGTTARIYTVGLKL